MSSTRKLKRIIAATLASAGLAMAGVGLTDATARADVPPTGPLTWCPGQELPPTGNRRTNPVIWDMNVCHTYFYVYHGQGNAAQNIWDGPNPPGPPPSGPFFTPPLPPGWCWSLFIPTRCP